MACSSQAFLQPCEVKEKVPSDSIFCLNQLLSGGMPKGPQIVQCANVHLMLGLDYQSSRGGDNKTEATKRVLGENGELTLYLAYSAKSQMLNPQITEFSNKEPSLPTPRIFKFKHLTNHSA